MENDKEYRLNMNKLQRLETLLARHPHRRFPSQVDELNAKHGKTYGHKTMTGALFDLNRRQERLEMRPY